MVARPQNMLLIILWAQPLILLAKHLLKEANIGAHKDLNQVGSVEIVVKLLNMILIAPRLDLGNDETLVLLDGLLYQISK